MCDKIGNIVSHIKRFVNRKAIIFARNEDLSVIEEIEIMKWDMLMAA